MVSMPFQFNIILIFAPETKTKQTKDPETNCVRKCKWNNVTVTIPGPTKYLHIYFHFSNRYLITSCQDASAKHAG